mmetsp:Transcript_11072/g.19219  ORF Transcript_11072/g.19219 Transcript_11072/m.19219 type:complete len:173 (-) Transcript_11072:715-1233(-)|eukprot:CAMPEP_0119108706 /NCGR_PEP_ID=MMETSP1180-20130426/15615_1 /TAXON_ID=3052 ORGANISM="Chlamydomonas cf sp, Strain CCMP681" /NCGR_SAMPLE_ID=MMETSP1180 /ASSEMBLY_ACC=CAM_ASM_000741 /LENGTH=172 /DNA_ID=CAMNT_0007094357 /DNA_START=391 /DNA_END=909 /DNA_ORIENTATION=-
MGFVLDSAAGARVSTVTSPIAAAAVSFAAKTARAGIAAAAGNTSPDGVNSVPLPSSKRHVVLHHETGHHHLPHTHTLAWEMETGFVVVLVAIHVVALCFWMYLLYASKDQRRRHAMRRSQGITAADPSTRVASPVAAGRRVGGSGSAWGSPGDILAGLGGFRTTEKQRLGKV